MSCFSIINERRWFYYHFGDVWYMRMRNENRYFVFISKDIKFYFTKKE